MREHAANDRARCGRDLRERKDIELRRDLALEPRLVALAWMLARPAAIAAMPFADRLASRAVHGGTAARIIACRSLRCERLARCVDRAETMLAPRLRHARLAMTAPALEHRLAAHRARERIGRARLRRLACAMHALHTAAAARPCEALRAAAIAPEQERCGAYSRL